MSIQVRTASKFTLWRYVSACVCYQSAGPLIVTGLAFPIYIDFEYFVIFIDFWIFWLLRCFCLLAESYETINHYHYHLLSIKKRLIQSVRRNHVLWCHNSNNNTIADVELTYKFRTTLNLIAFRRQLVSTHVMGLNPSANFQ